MRPALSLKEAIVLADVPEKRVRKDIEVGLLSSLVIMRSTTAIDGRIAVRWNDVFVLAAAYGGQHLNARLRQRILEYAETIADVSSADSSFCKASSETIEIDKYVTLDLDKVVALVKPRMDLYAAGLRRIETRKGVLGGEAVFKHTRLPVLHVGKVYERGIPMADILNDYPYLTEDDVKFAQLYFHAHPPVGRPRRDGTDVRDDTVPPVA
ncbi:MAG TPA: DUF433 domain-containing protein [Acetobacteraceae bacterium]|jgi:uncharacterized protein (DUF433 family)